MGQGSNVLAPGKILLNFETTKIKKNKIQVLHLQNPTMTWGSNIITPRKMC